MANRSSSRSRSPLRRLTEAFADLVIARQHLVRDTSPMNLQAETTPAWVDFAEIPTETRTGQPDYVKPDYDKLWWFDNRWWELEHGKWWTKWFENKDDGNNFTWIPLHKYDYWFDNRKWEWEQGKWWTQWIEHKDTGNTVTWIPWHLWRSGSK